MQEESKTNKNIIDNLHNHFTYQNLK